MPAANQSFVRFLIAALLLGSVTLGNRSLAQGAPERLYQIELLVFAHEGNRGTFVAAPGATAPRMRGAVALKPGDSSPDTEDALFTVLDSTQRAALAGARQRLDSAGATQVIAHLAWRQPMFAFQSSRRVSLTQDLLNSAQAGASNADFALEGTIALQRGRFINLELDLKLSEGGDLWEWEQGEEIPDRVYRLKERRQIKLEETHYYDHGAFGSIVRVSSYTPPDQEPSPEPAPEPDLDQAD